MQVYKELTIISITHQVNEPNHQLFHIRGKIRDNYYSFSFSGVRKSEATTWRLENNTTGKNAVLDNPSNEQIYQAMLKLL